EEDVSGQILSSEWSDDWTHLCIPMQYEARRHCVTVLGWEDPRGLDKDGKSLLDGGVPRDTAAQLELEEREGALMPSARNLEWLKLNQACVHGPVIRVLKLINSRVRTFDDLRTLGIDPIEGDRHDA